MIPTCSNDKLPRGAAPQTLIVEDDPVSRDALLKILRLVGLEAAGAGDVAQGLQALDPPPHNVILDLMLPDGSGIDILRHIRRHNLPVRVALLTGAGQDVVAQARILRPDAVFVKPADLGPLIDWLKAA
jgi:DNA-binding response OmpR family regulator